ncbi:hypothetical protein [Inquilinus limosus]|nr:hypothetical protein [Inquilinus limosus]
MALRLAHGSAFGNKALFAPFRPTTNRGYKRFKKERPFGNALM